MFVSLWISPYGADMDTTLMGKSAFTNIRPVFIRNKIGHLINEKTQFAQLPKLFRLDSTMAHFEDHVGNNGTEVGIPTPFAITVHRSLDMRAPCSHSHERIRDTEFSIIVGMNAEFPFEDSAHPGDNIINLIGHAAAICITEDNGIRSGVIGRFDDV